MLKEGKKEQFCRDSNEVTTKDYFSKWQTAWEIDEKQANFFSSISVPQLIISVSYVSSLWAHLHVPVCWYTKMSIKDILNPSNKLFYFEFKQ